VEYVLDMDVGWTVLMCLALFSIFAFGRFMKNVTLKMDMSWLPACLFLGNLTFYADNLFLAPCASAACAPNFAALCAPLPLCTATFTHPLCEGATFCARRALGGKASFALGSVVPKATWL